MIPLRGSRLLSGRGHDGQAVRLPLLSPMKTDYVPELRVQFTKRPDGTVVLRCLRRDGSATWERHEKQAMFFAFHDLRHFAVETTLSLPRGFYGLIADGWDIADTSGKGARGKLSPDSILVEHVVGLFERERAGGAAPMTAAEFNTQIREMIGKDVKMRPLLEEELSRARKRTEELHAQWIALLPGSTLELEFDRTAHAKI
jgi:hypothetical protein